MKHNSKILQALGTAGYTIGTLFGGIRAGVGGNGTYFKQFEGTGRDRFRDRPGKILQSEDNALNLNQREELMSEARNLAMTYGIVKRIMRAYANYCVGSCRVKWHTGDPEIDKIYQNEWRMWMKNADANGILNFRTMTRLMVVSTLRDGDIFGQGAIAGSNMDAEPILRMIEADRVSSSGMFNSDLFNPDQKQMYGGISVGLNGRPTSVRVWKRGGFGTFRDPMEIPYTEIFHPFQSDRADSYRGVTAFHTALNSLRDLKETVRAESLSAKRHSKLSLLVKTLTGGRMPGAQFDAFSPDGAGGRNDPSVQQLADAVDMYMFPGESATAHMANRPSDGWIKLMQWMVREIAIGLDLPYEVVWDMSGLGGANTRFTTATANRTFTNFTEEVVEQRWIIPIAGWVISRRIAQKRIPFHPNWHNYLPHRPASITVDAGRDSKAGINEIAAGLSTSTRWIAEEDGDFEEITERQAQEAQFRQKMEEKYTLKPGTLGSPVLVSTRLNTGVEEEPEPDNDPDDKDKTGADKTKKKNKNGNAKPSESESD